jgi:hypothetical protein
MIETTVDDEPLEVAFLFQAFTKTTQSRSFQGSYGTAFSLMNVSLLAWKQ